VAGGSFVLNMKGQHMNRDCVVEPDDQCTDVASLAYPHRWQPSGYVNPYRLPPYEADDIFDRLTGVECWPNELNEMARQTLSTACFLLFGFPLLLLLLYATVQRMS
jgi:hypothetical protein